MLTFFKWVYQLQLTVLARCKLRLLRIAVLLAIACLPMYVYSSTTTRAYDGTFTFTLENDIFTDSDNNYTNGMALTWTSNELSTYDDSEFPYRWGQFWSFLPYIQDEGYETYVAWTVGQQMHTPHDITDPDPPLDDQPYAGILYLDSVLHARRGRWGHTYNLRLGVVGPASLAEDTQVAVHRILGADKPRGWDTQLPNEPVFNLDFTTRYVLGDVHFGQSAQWRLVPVGTVSIGNYLTALNVGLYSDIGWNLPASFATTRLRQGFSGASTVGSGPMDSWSFAFFVGVSGFAVTHYLPLDGTVFSDSRSVDTRSYISSRSIGMTVRWKGIVLSIGQTQFSKMFDTERARADFGTLGFAWYF